MYFGRFATSPTLLFAMGAVVLAVSSIACRDADPPAQAARAAETPSSAPPLATAATSSAAASSAGMAPAPRAQSHPPANASPPSAVDPKEEPLGATRAMWIDFVARAARYRGKAPDLAAIRAAFDAPIRLVGDDTPTLWGKLCPELGLADEDGLDVLCQDGINWAPTLVVTDIDGDGKTDYMLFGTWTVAAHQDALLALFSEDGDRIKRVTIPNEVPFKTDAGISFFDRPFVNKGPTGMFVHAREIERWNAKGEEIGYSPMEEARRSRETVRVYRLEGFVPRLVETRVEEWDAVKGTRKKTIPAPAK